MSEMNNMGDIPQLQETPISHLKGTVYNIADGSVDSVVEGRVSSAGITYLYGRGGIHFLPSVASEVMEITVNMATSLSLKAAAEALSQGDLDRASEFITSCQVLFGQLATAKTAEKLLTLASEDD